MQVGSFELRSVIGRGAMAEVWRAVHVSQGIPVAVKVLTADKARSPRFQQLIHNEARAMAGLHHPGIALVYDVGRTDEGSPWIAMEMATGGSLEDLVDIEVPWHDLKPLLLALLDALAHAHARGVLHRDLKPANVLMCSEGDLRPGIKLSDFGLAMPLNTAEGSTRISGTPAFMAPEQVRGAWRDFGPWTDLYAFGCLAWQICCGFTPFRGERLEDWLRAHLEDEPGDLAPRSAVPAGLEAWLRRLLEKSPARRYRAAADVAWGLLQLGDAVHTGPSPWPLSGRSHLSLNPTVIGMLEAVRAEGSTAETVPLPRPECAPLVRDWRREEDEPSLRMQGAGLGLFALRSVPMVGRAAERDQVWACLFRAVQGAEAQAVIVRGPAGVGKTRLCDWVCQRAAEMGAVNVLRVTHSPVSGPEDGVQGMLRRLFRCQGLAREEAEGRIRRGLRSLGLRSPQMAQVLTALIVGGELEASRSQRQEHVAELVDALSWRRPVLLWVDDAHFGAEAVSLCRHIMERQASACCPALLLLSAHDLAATALPRGTPIDLGPLGDEDHLLLTRSLLGLEEDLARQVSERTLGNPLFATQLVADWVQRGVLVPGPAGFSLRAADAVLPDSVHQLVRVQLERLVSDPVALQLTACLGRRVRLEELEALTELPDMPALEAAGLLRVTPTELSFRHEVVRESVLRSAHESEQLADHHARCAEVLDRLYPHRPRGTWARLAAHQFAAGSFEQAASSLRQAAQEARNDGDLEGSLRQLDRWEQAMSLAEVPADRAEWGQGLVARAHAMRSLHRDDEALDAASRAERLARSFGWPEVLARALTAQGLVSARSGDTEGAGRLLTEAVQRCAEAGLDRDRGTAIMGLAWIAMRAEEHASAEQLFSEAVDIFGRQTAECADALNGLAEVFRAQGQHARARSLYEQSLAVSTSSITKAVVRLNLGLCMLRAQEHREARVVVEKAWREFRRQGRSRYQGFAAALLLPTLAAAANWSAFDQRLEEATSTLSETGAASADAAWALVQASSLCKEASQARRGWSCMVLALAQYRAAGAEEEAEQVRLAMKG